VLPSDPVRVDVEDGLRVRVGVGYLPGSVHFDHGVRHPLCDRSETLFPRFQIGQRGIPPARPLGGREVDRDPCPALGRRLEQQLPVALLDDPLAQPQSDPLAVFERRLALPVQRLQFQVGDAGAVVLDYDPCALRAGGRDPDPGRLGGVVPRRVVDQFAKRFGDSVAGEDAAVRRYIRFDGHVRVSLANVGDDRRRHLREVVDGRSRLPLDEAAVFACRLAAVDQTVRGLPDFLGVRDVLFRDFRRQQVRVSQDDVQVVPEVVSEMPREDLSKQLQFLFAVTEQLLLFDPRGNVRHHDDEPLVGPVVVADRFDTRLGDPTPVVRPFDEKFPLPLWPFSHRAPKRLVDHLCGLIREKPTQRVAEDTGFGVSGQFFELRVRVLDHALRIGDGRCGSAVLDRAFETAELAFLASERLDLRLQFQRLAAADQQRPKPTHQELSVDRCPDELVDEQRRFGVTASGVLYADCRVRPVALDDDDRAERRVIAGDPFPEVRAVLLQQTVFDEIQIRVADRVAGVDVELVGEHIADHRSVTLVGDEELDGVRLRVRLRPWL